MTINFIEVAAFELIQKNTNKKFWYNYKKTKYHNSRDTCHKWYEGQDSVKRNVP